MQQHDIFDLALIDQDIIAAERARASGDITGAIKWVSSAIAKPAPRHIRDWLHLAKDALRKESGADVIAPARWDLCINSLRANLYA